MQRTLAHLRDFLTPEELKFLPGRLQTGLFMLLTQHKLRKEKYTINGKEKEHEITVQVLQVFDSTGTWIGEISDPDFIPSFKN